MRLWIHCFAAIFVLMPGLAVAQMQPYSPKPNEQYANLPDAGEQIFALANQAREQAGLQRLNWDPALAHAALAHCRLMARKGPISHQYSGEPDLTARAGQAGAHFSLIEENVAVGPTPEEIHQEWMHSPGHRANLLNPKVDRIGVAVVASHGVLYAVEDFSQAVLALQPDQVEAQVASLIRVSGVGVLQDVSVARRACHSNDGIPTGPQGRTPGFVMRWQSPDLTRLPKPLADRLASGRYKLAAVGACPAQGVSRGFTDYRVAVLLY